MRRAAGGPARRVGGAELVGRVHPARPTYGAAGDVGVEYDERGIPFRGGGQRLAERLAQRFTARSDQRRDERALLSHGTRTPSGGRAARRGPRAPGGSPPTSA